MWVYLKVENDLENVNLDAFWYLIQIYWILIMSVARQNSRIDADHTANTKLYSDRPTKQNVINVCGFIFIASAPLIANYGSQTVSAVCRWTNTLCLCLVNWSSLPPVMCWTYQLLFSTIKMRWSGGMVKTHLLMRWWFSSWVWARTSATTTAYRGNRGSQPLDKKKAYLPIYAFHPTFFPWWPSTKHRTLWPFYFYGTTGDHGDQSSFIFQWTATFTTYSKYQGDDSEHIPPPQSVSQQDQDT